MDKKTLAIVSYITIIGWLIAYFQYKDKERDPFVIYHLKQSLGIAIISIILGVAINLVVSMVPALSVVVYANIAILVLWVLGILNALNGLKKPVPVVGPLFENKFAFLNVNA
ncbi:DUF4870 domain-containing protein [Chitinophaga solisilvae]|uniref:DUF4870 domain-containing protein n=1 Tax=Chitinophaga solisilvae TaxID=1233460 RepID=A0A433WBS9_9BACT|nr:DUF4870 domain-containing protein [Chitinophaga solisilvae]NSL85294.1 DUF4870 domain-containing protein [Chitinophaga solisilvae]